MDRQCHAVQDMQNLITFGHACVPQGVSAFLERTNWAKACGGAARSAAAWRTAGGGGHRAA